MFLKLYRYPINRLMRPSRMMDHHFGVSWDPEFFIDHLMPRELRKLMGLNEKYWQRTMAAIEESGTSTTIDKDKFQVNVDVQQFKPEEISVKVADNTVTIEGKHEERKDEHGFISRHFVRKYVLPKGHDVAKLESKLSSDGVLTVTAPKVVSEESEFRDVPITQTGQPSKPTIAENTDEKRK